MPRYGFSPPAPMTGNPAGRDRRSARFWAAAVSGPLVGIACAAAVAVVPANADRGAADAVMAADTTPVARETAFLQALDQAGIGHPNNGGVISIAQNVCQRMRDLFSPAEIADDLEKANPGLVHSHAVAFVKVSHIVYCPGVASGDLPGYPGQE